MFKEFLDTLNSKTTEQIRNRSANLRFGEFSIVGNQAPKGLIVLVSSDGKVGFIKS